MKNLGKIFLASTLALGGVKDTIGGSVNNKVVENKKCIELIINGNLSELTEKEINDNIGLKDINGENVFSHKCIINQINFMKYENEDYLNVQNRLFELLYKRNDYEN